MMAGTGKTKTIILLPWSEQYERKKYGGHSTGCTQAPVIVILIMFDICWDVRNNQCSYIQCQIIISLEAEITLVMCFHIGAKKIKGHHIKNKVHVICMNQSAGNESVILVFFVDSRGPEYQFVNHFAISESD